jgi:hypothetical protein
MESLNDHVPEFIEPLGETPEPTPKEIREELMRRFRALLARRIGWPGSIAIGLFLLVVLVGSAYFLGYPLHGAAGPD